MRELRGRPATASVISSPPPPTLDDAHASWSAMAAWLGNALAAALVSGDQHRAHEVATVVRAFAPLAQARNASVDLTTIEADFTALKERFAELHGAAQQGSRVQMEGPQQSGRHRLS